MCDNWYDNMDKGRLTSVVFLDIRKAFNSVDHSILLQKVQFHGVADRELIDLVQVLSYLQQQLCLKEHCHRSFAVFSFIRCLNLYLVPLLVLKMRKWTKKNISNEWWLREQTIMNFWQYFQGMALEFEKNWLVFSNFNPFPSLPC